MFHTSLHTPLRTVARAFLTVVATVVALFLAAGPAAAHISVTPNEVSADNYGVIRLMVPHGCEGEATNRLEVSLPESLVGVKAEAVPGWTVSYELAERTEPVMLHGNEVTDYVAVVSWETDNDPLADDQFLTFGINARFPDEPGEMLLPVVQTCVDGSEEAWVSDDHSASHPAPKLTLTAATGSGHGSDDAADADDGDHASEVAAPAPTTQDSDSSSLPLTIAVAAIVGGAVGAVSSRIGR